MNNYISSIMVGFFLVLLLTISWFLLQVNYVSGTVEWKSIQIGDQGKKIKSGVDITPNDLPPGAELRVAVLLDDYDKINGIEKGGIAIYSINLEDFNSIDPGDKVRLRLLDEPMKAEIIDVKKGPRLEVLSSQTSCMKKPSGIELTPMYGLISVNGSVMIPDPCYGIDPSLDVNGNILTIDLRPFRTGGMCIQCVGSLEFRMEIGNLEPGKGYTLRIMKNGELVKEENVYIPESTDNVTVNYSVSECLNNTDPLKWEGIDAKGTNGGIEIWHHLSYLCCADIHIEARKAGDVVEVTEVNRGGMCRCQCAYVVNATIYPLGSGDYTIRVYGVKDETGTNYRALLEKRVSVG